MKPSIDNNLTQRSSQEQNKPTHISPAKEKKYEPHEDKELGSGGPARLR